jgi:hypothetical protein
MVVIFQVLPFVLQMQLMFVASQRGLLHPVSVLLGPFLSISRSCLAWVINQPGCVSRAHHGALNPAMNRVKPRFNPIPIHLPTCFARLTSPLFHQYKCGNQAAAHEHRVRGVRSQSAGPLRTFSAGTVVRAGHGLDPEVRTASRLPGFAF